MKLRPRRPVFQPQRIHLFWRVVNPTPAGAVSAMSVHEFLAWTLLTLIGVHVAAAFWHHVVARDATLRRMLPRPSGIELGWRR